MRRNTILMTLLALVAIAVIGCGGGGGGGSSDDNNNTTDNYVVSGTVMLNGTTTTAIKDAAVTVGGKTVKSGSDGKFSIQFTTAPTAKTYVVDGSTATASTSNGQLTGFYDFWAKVNGVNYNAKCIKMPSISSKSINLGTIYLMSYESAPPFPISCN